LDAMWQRVQLIMEAAEQSKCQALVLSAFGCGAFSNPPDVVADLFAQALCRPWSCLERVVFCILDDHNAGRRHNPRGNLRPFAEVFEHRGRPPHCAAPIGQPQPAAGPAARRVCEQAVVSGRSRAGAAGTHWGRSSVSSDSDQ